MDALQGEGAGIDLELVDRLPTHERREQAGQPQDVIEVTVGDQDAVQAAETEPRSKDLPLRPLAAVDEESVVLEGNDLRRKSAMNGRRRGRRAEEGELEQLNPNGGRSLYPSRGASCPDSPAESPGWPGRHYVGLEDTRPEWNQTASRLGKSLFRPSPPGLLSADCVNQPEETWWRGPPLRYGRLRTVWNILGKGGVKLPLDDSRGVKTR